MTTTRIDSDEAARLVERHDCPMCEAPAGSPCRTKGGKVATTYHTGRFGRVSSLKAELGVKVPESRGPRTTWVQQTADENTTTPEPLAGPAIRIGYARCSTAQQELQSQLDILARANCHRVFSEKISTRIKVRPEFEAALALAKEFRKAAPDQPVILTATEMKRLARNAAELMTLSSTLQTEGISLELLTGPLTGIYDPQGAGAIVFAVLAVSAEVEREGIREKTLEGLETARSKGNHGGRPKVVDDDMLAVALSRKEKGERIADIAKILRIPEGQKNAGQPVSPATLYRVLAEHAAKQAACE